MRKLYVHQFHFGILCFILWLKLCLMYLKLFTRCSALVLTVDALNTNPTHTVQNEPNAILDFEQTFLHHKEEIVNGMHLFSREINDRKHRSI